MSNGKRLTEAQKGKMARGLVYYCISMLTAAAVWAMVLKTYSAITGVSVDLSAELTFVATVFGGELLLLLFKRIFAKPTEKQEE